MADNNFLSSLLNYGQSLAQHYLPVQQAPQAGQGMLSNIYSTIDSTKRKLSDFVQNPVESTRQFISNQNEDSGKQLGLLNQAFTGADGRPTISPQTPQAQAAHNQLTDGMTAAMMGATVWHGSPHKFDAFDSSKIGTGEGAQAYGHGLYLADNPGVAQSYIPANAQAQGTIKGLLKKETTRAQKYSNEGGMEVYEMFQKGNTPAGIRQNIDNLIESGEAHPAYIKKMEQAYKKATDIYKANPAGAMYKVDLPDEHIAKMLDWDKPLSAQHPDVQTFFNSHPKVSERVGQMEAERVKLNTQFPGRLANPALKNIVNKEATADNLKGAQLYEIMTNGASIGGEEAARVAALRQAGIPGIRYLDGGSRATGGTSNYVVFPGNEHLLNIQERNGVPLSSLLNK